MRDAVKLLGSLALAVAVGASANAQTIGGGSGGTTTGGGGGGGGGGGAGGASGNNEIAPIEVITTPPITGVSAYGGSGAAANNAINASNFLRNTYGNVYYQGRAGAAPDEVPGGFGQMLYGTAGGGTGGNIGFAGGTSGGLGSVTGSSSTLGGRAGGAGGLGAVGGSTGRLGGGTTGTLGGGLGRQGGGLNSSSVGGVIVPMSRPIAYQGVLKFQAPVAPPAQVHADIRGMLDRSSMIANPRNVSVISDGPGVVLRGSAADEDEARMIEGMVRLTPGVQFVTNELQYPRQ